MKDDIDFEKVFQQILGDDYVPGKEVDGVFLTVKAGHIEEVRHVIKSMGAKLIDTMYLFNAITVVGLSKEVIKEIPNTLIVENTKVRITLTH